MFYVHFYDDTKIRLRFSTGTSELRILNQALYGICFRKDTAFMNLYIQNSVLVTGINLMPSPYIKYALNYKGH